MPEWITPRISFYWMVHYGASLTPAVLVLSATGTYYTNFPLVNFWVDSIVKVYITIVLLSFFNR